MSQKTLVALSGGVDSLITAWLLKKQGMQLRGVHIDVMGHPKINEQVQQWERKLGIPIQVISCTDQIENFFPVIVEALNRGKRLDLKSFFHQHILFPKLFELKQQIQFQKVATGHRVLLNLDSVEKVVRVFRYQELTEDESGLLIGLSQKEISDLELPLGGIPASMVKKIGLELNLGDSSEFDPNWGDLIERVRMGMKDQPKMVEVSLGEGGPSLGNYADFTTVKLGDVFPDPVVKEKSYIVWDLDGAHRKMIVGDQAQRSLKELHVEDASWFALDDLKMEPLRCALGWEKSTRAIPVKIVQFEGGHMKVFLETPLKGTEANIYNGQTVLWVTGGEVLGGARVMLCK